MEVQELRRATKRLAGALMWHFGERIPERITEQTVNLPAPPHLGREPFDKDGRQYFDCKDHQACRDPADSLHRHGCRYAGGDATTGPANSDAVDDRGSSLQPSDQACPDSADAAHRQGCRYAYCDTATGPSDTDGLEECESPAGAVRWDSCDCARDHADHDFGGTTGPSVSDCAEDRESPTGAARERMHEQIVDVPVPQVALNERISERMHAQIVDVPVPRKMKEGVEPESRDFGACDDATTGPSDSNCDKDGCFPVDQPGDQACRVSAGSAHRQGRRRAGGDATTGPSCSGSIEEALSDGPQPSSAEEQLLRTTMLNRDTRALWENISQLPESDVKDELRQQLCGFIQHRLVLEQTAAAQPSSLPTPSDV